MEIKKLTDIPNIGKRVEKDLNLIGITKPSHLAKKDPYKMYMALCKKTGVRQHPAVLDVFMSAVAYVNGAPKTPWWFFTPERKRLYPHIKRVY